MAYISLLSTATRVPWGLSLLPEEKEAKIGALRQLYGENIAFKPALERHVIVELIRHNRLFIDLRHSAPAISVLFTSRWFKVVIMDGHWLRMIERLYQLNPESGFN